jgi:hypothetical protein
MDSGKKKSIFSKFRTHKSVSLGSAGVLVGDDDGLKDVSELLEVGLHALFVRLPFDLYSIHQLPEDELCV